MDSNLMSCPTCGHSVSNIAGACTYCGAMVAEKGSSAKADDNKDIGQNAQVAQSPPPLPQGQTRQADKTSDEAGENPLTAKEPPESDVSQPPADSPATAESLAPSTEAQAVSADEWTSVEDEAESKPAVDEQELKSAPQSSRVNQDLEDNSEVAQTEADGPESAPAAAAAPAPVEKPGIQEPEGETIPAPDNVVPIEGRENPTETATDAIQSPPEPEAVDKSGDETGETETLEETTVEPSEIQAAPQESAIPSTPEMPAPVEKPVEEAETKPVKDTPPKKEADLSDDAKAGSAPKSLGDTIVLEIDDEVEPVAAASPDTTEKSAPSESRVEAQRNNRPMAGLTKAQALKKQKAAQAKVQALKRQKLVLAKAAALKRKKEIQVKALADSEAAKKNESPAAAPTPKLESGPAANSRMQTLLEKYKGRLIGINYDNSADIRKAQFVEANAEYFSVFVKDQNLKYSYPLRAVLSVIEGKDGVDIGSSKQPQKFVAVIKLYPMVLF